MTTSVIYVKIIAVHLYIPPIIAVVWDFDKTLVDGYMQDPIFEEYNVESKEFWKEVNSLPDKYMKEQSINE